MTYFGTLPTLAYSHSI